MLQPCLMALGLTVVLMPAAYAVSASHTSGTHIIVQADELKWVAAPAALPAGAKMALMEGDPRKPGPFTLRFKFPNGYKISPHWHPADEHVTVLEGTFLIGVGDRWDRSKAKVLTAGGYTMMPKGHHHYAGADGDVTVQLHGVGPWQIHYINPMEDPRRKGPAKK